MFVIYVAELSPPETGVAEGSVIQAQEPPRSYTSLLGTCHLFTIYAANMAC